MTGSHTVVAIWLKSLCVVHGGLSQDVIPSGSSRCFSDVVWCFGWHFHGVESVDGAQECLFPQERVPRRIGEQLVDVPVSQIMDGVEAFHVQVHAFSNEFQTSFLSHS